MALSRFCALALAVGLAACTDDNGPDATIRDAGPPPEIPQPGLEIGPSPIDGYCEARSRVECHRLEVCRPQILESLYRTQDACASDLTDQCERSFTELSAQVIVEQGLVSFDPERMGQALSEYSKRPCDSSTRVPGLQVGVIGLIADESPCGSSPLCQSGYCDRMDFQPCGQCRPPPATLPERCPASCALGQACHCEAVTGPDGGTRGCECRDAIARDDRCDEQRDACEDGTRCIDVRMGAMLEARCRAYPWPEQACGGGTGFYECGGQAYCALDGERGRCMDPVVVANDEACDGRARLCAPGSDCVLGTCLSRAKDGEPCIVSGTTPPPDAGIQPFCESGRCFGGTCAPRGMLYDFCRQTSDCAAPLGCYFSGPSSGSCLDETTARSWIESAFMQCR